MNKKIWIVIIIISCILIVGSLFVYFFYNPFISSNYEARKTTALNLNNDNNTTSSETNQSTNNNYDESNPTDIANEINETKEQIATFSTKIYSKDSARQNNISITCNTLNDTIVKKGETFSFCQTVGQATSSKGYQKADIFDKDGKKKKGLGGGNCQISTTLYNALLSVPSLVVTERHKHSSYVPYIEKGKDSAVAYGSYDLKFRNDSGNDIKIQSYTDSEKVTVNLYTLK